MSQEHSLSQHQNYLGGSRLSVVNLSILKNNRAKAVRFTTLTGLCDALGCTPGDLFTVQDVASP